MVCPGRVFESSLHKAMRGAFQSHVSLSWQSAHRPLCAGVLLNGPESRASCEWAAGCLLVATTSPWKNFLGGRCLKSPQIWMRVSVLPVVDWKCQALPKVRQSLREGNIEGEFCFHWSNHLYSSQEPSEVSVTVLIHRRGSWGSERQVTLWPHISWEAAEQWLDLKLAWPQSCIAQSPPVSTFSRTMLRARHEVYRYRPSSPASTGWSGYAADQVGTLKRKKIISW